MYLIGMPIYCFFAAVFVFLQTLVLYVLIFCVILWELSHLTQDLSQAEKKLNVDKSCANAQYDIYFTQNDQSCHFVSLSACNNSHFLLSLR